ncbi:hypothetical protein D1159_03195 [Pseudoflavonifractor sp. 524-17]|uniref:hypothetical protein n=1 Tax=Pseudoflavonifractor sp. 524-17 TaxID=2304577 RepID=UPI001379DC13|nr:hypothetical protein [Pseudoflavonifractor sp. 524-17]NCE63607.1 hypothetical protein [Pseudoflavonifractor sp. 524-17]
MGVDLNFWRYREGVYLDNGAVYQMACCENEHIDGLDLLPVEDILRETAAVFQDWDRLDPFSYEKNGRSAFQISAAAQAVRFDCYCMEPADMRRFSSLMAKFGCPLYDPQLGVRFDKIAAFFTGEAGEYAAQGKQELSRLLPGLEVDTWVGTWEESARLAKTLPCIQYHGTIHRAKTLTKATSFLQFGRAWANRPCQCKTAQLAQEDTARQILGELLCKSIQRVVEDARAKTYYA